MTKLWWRLVRFAFRLLYNELAFTYDWVSTLVSLGAWRCWQRAALKYLPHQTEGPILELAHGTGDLQVDLHTAGYKTIGCDLSLDMGHIAQQKLRKHGLESKLVRSKAQRLPFPDTRFAAVISTFPADFIVAPETLLEVYRVLAPGGHFIIVLNGILTGGGLTKRFLEWLYQITGQREGSGFEIASFFAEYHFEATMLEEPCSHSVAQVILARKLP